MKKILFLVILISDGICGLSQDSLLNNHKFQLTINIAIPRDYNTPKMTPIISETMIQGYFTYNKLGGALTTEYLKKIKLNLFLKVGIDFTMYSGYITAKGNEVLVLHQCHNPETKCLYETNYKIITMGPLVGINYRLNSKSSIFLNTSPNLFDLGIYKNTDWSQQIDNNMELSFLKGFFFMLFKGGYTHSLYKKINFSLNTFIFSDNISNPYLSIGLRYNF